MTEYRKSRLGVYPTEFDWSYSVIAPDRTRVTNGGFATAADARKAARRTARVYDRLERDRVDGVVDQRTDQVLEHGVRNCERCGQPHNLVAVTRRGRRCGQTWAAPDGHSYHGESWESVARRLLAERQAA